ncbi:hypothetical protein JTE90_015708 [Oedothorax gibbosus]|uniref:Uncharacterized protein n=1 Tax=Oedothorax gibbosus TaxID=931172 RepID=A0AAV6UM76_9ARAC|nr:hypothetical protein JTE90_015708 [Oedothorax gibbosus]
MSPVGSAEYQAKNTAISKDEGISVLVYWRPRKLLSSIGSPDTKETTIPYCITVVPFGYVKPGDIVDK